MQADKGSQVRDENENLSNIQQELRNLEAAGRIAQDQLNRCQGKISSHKKRKNELKIQMDRAHDNMGRLEDEVIACTPDAAQIGELERELAVAKEQVEMDEGQYANFVEQKDQADADGRFLKRQLEEANQVLKEAEFHYDKVSTKIHTFTQRRVHALRDKNAALANVEEAENNWTNWNEKRVARLKNIQEKTVLATGVCSRVHVPPGETFESLGRKVEANREAREAAEKELGGSEVELVTVANDAKKSYMDAQKLVGDTENVRRVSLTSCYLRVSS